jgi:hypothetical protein
MTQKKRKIESWGEEGHKSSRAITSSITFFSTSVVSFLGFSFFLGKTDAEERADEERKTRHFLVFSFEGCVGRLRNIKNISCIYFYYFYDYVSLLLSHMNIVLE